MRRFAPLLFLLCACPRTEIPKETGVVDTDDSSVDTQGQAVDADGDGFDEGEDCDDDNAAVNPDARETCDGIDNDCDGLFDDEDVDVFGTSTFYADSDGDGYGGEQFEQEACERPDGYVDTHSDCDDNDAGTHPGADEVCDGIDNDCDGTVDGDDATDALTWYEDGDGDGYGTNAAVETACDPPAGFALHDGDCDDADPAYNPGALEADCTDPVDYNCDGSVGYDDADGDGFAACEECDDSDADINEDAAETCDGIDNDCDGWIDDVDPDVTGTTVFHGDADGDGYGGSQFQADACTAPPGYVSNSDDCNDVDASSHPGASEVCDDADNDCDGDIDEGVGTPWYQDSDGDGYGNGSVSTTSCDAPSGYVGNALDCDDFSASTSPAAYEICDGADNDCDGSLDEDAINASTWYVDGDSDGYGSLTGTTSACDQPTGYAGNATDCDDADGSVNPGATEACDGTDNDCDGSTDEGVTNTYFADSDSDGYGNAASTVDTCSLPSTGYVTDATDCDDADGSSYPGATDTWYDGIDSDCDGGSDHDQDGDGHDTTASGGDDTNDSDASCWNTCPDGTSQSTAHTTCGTLLADIPTASDGTYWIDPDADGDTSNAFQVYCDMTNGGWTYQSDGSPWAVAYTGGSQSLTSHARTTEYLFTLHGAAGGFGYNNGGPTGCGSGSNKGGLGGQAIGSVTLSPSTTVFLEVGGQGTTGGCADQGAANQSTGGYNGGGRGSRGGSGGGGATDIRTGGSGLANRILVAGGGGGCGYESCVYGGGDGGGLEGTDGQPGGSGIGYGGTQSAGGQNQNNNSGGYGSAGTGGNNVQDNDEGGGGGGYFGGSAGGTSNAPGGGGSSYHGGMDGNQATTPGINDTNGYVEYVYR
jgi:hypothetical protein